MDSQSKALMPSWQALVIFESEEDNRREVKLDLERKDEPAGSDQALPLLGMNLSATPLLHQRCRVGGGPSSKR